MMRMRCWIVLGVIALALLVPIGHGHANEEAEEAQRRKQHIDAHQKAVEEHIRSHDASQTAHQARAQDRQDTTNQEVAAEAHEQSQAEKIRNQEEEEKEDELNDVIDLVIEEGASLMFESKNVYEARLLFEQAYNEVDASASSHANASYYLALSHLIGTSQDSSSPSKYAKAKQLFEEASQEGHALAQRDLAFMYSVGYGIDKDSALSLLNYYFAAIGGDNSASMVLGYRHMYGIGVPKSCEAAVRYYMEASEKVVELVEKGELIPYLEKVDLTDEKARIQPIDEDEDVIHYYEHAADGGDVNAQVVLGHLNQQGARGVQRDIGRANQFFQAASNQGDPSAMAQLAQMYAEGAGVKQNNETAYKYFRKSADLGHHAGFYGLGFLHLHGQGVKKDISAAVKFFKQAAERGSPEAQFSLGTLYYTGKGVDKSHVTALHYFTAAGHQGHTTALFNLAQMHLLGLGTIKSCSFGVRLHKVVAERGPWALDIGDAHKAYLDGDYAQALLLYGRTAEMGFEVSQANAGWMLEQPMGYYEEDHHELALHFWRLAADQGNADAQRVLGDYYYYGRVGSADFKEAIRRYQQAADRRNAHALFNLGYMYQSGDGVPQDLHLAKRYYDMAIQASSEAYVPSSLALMLVRFQVFLEKLWSLGSSVDVVVEVDAGLKDAVEDTDATSSDDTLLLIMCAALALVIYMRRHRLNE